MEKVKLVVNLNDNFFWELKRILADKKELMNRWIEKKSLNYIPNLDDIKKFDKTNRPRKTTILISIEAYARIRDITRKYGISIPDWIESLIWEEYFKDEVCEAG